VKDERTGELVRCRRNLPEADLRTARAWLDDERARLRAGEASAFGRSRMRFYEYATLLFERKVASGEIRSEMTRDSWQNSLTNQLIPYFGNFYIDAIRPTDIEAWKASVANATYVTGKRRKSPLTSSRALALAPQVEKPYLPESKNTWLKHLKAIFSAAAAEFEWPKDPCAKIKPFDNSTHETYTHEEPNSLLDDQTARFLAIMAKRFPQHFAMTALGFATGLRPSTMRPLRRCGDSPDIIWNTGLLLVRRSQTKGDPMNKTKTGKRQKIWLPEALMRVLWWHVQSLPSGVAQRSDLLFPSRTGGFRARSVLDKPFAAVAAEAGVPHNVTARAMRRSYNDLMRFAGVDSIVKRSISGHATEEMEEHYSSVLQREQKDSIARLMSVAHYDDALSLASAAIADGMTLPADSNEEEKPEAGDEGAGEEIFDEPDESEGPGSGGPGLGGQGPGAGRPRGQGGVQVEYRRRFG
jgi:site-specific recombinase XerC